MERYQIRWTARDEDALGEQAWRWLAQAFAMPALLATPPRALSGIALPPSRLAAGDKLAALLSASGLRQDDMERARHAAGGGLANLLRRRAGDLSSAPDAVLYPRNEGDVLAMLKLCTERGIAVVPFGSGTDDVAPVRGGIWSDLKKDFGAVVTLNLSGLNRVTTFDMMSGLAEVEAGITGAELERQMMARGMMPVHRPGACEFSTLGGWIAQSGAAGATDWLRGLRVATPQGLLTGDTRLGLDLKQMMPGSGGTLGVITGATIRIRALPEKQETRAYLFPDFASGLTAVRETQRTGLAHSLMRLSDADETRFSRALQHPTLGDNFFDVYLSIRRFDGHAARLVAGFSGSAREVRAARKRFDRLASGLGALALGGDPNWQRQRLALRREALLDRGIGIDRIAIPASWSELPSLYVKLRAALKQAMRAHVPRPGAHGLVLCQVGPAWPDGANLTVTWLFPRKLEDEITQAQTVRAAALAALPARTGEALEQDVLRGIKQALDPQGILNPRMLV